MSTRHEHDDPVRGYERTSRNYGLTSCEHERIVPMRVQRFLARSGVASRRGSEALMTAGRVRVNGVVVTELGSKVDPLTDVVSVDGIEVKPSDRATYLMLYKPAGYITTMSDPYGRPCVSDLVASAKAPGLFPVGRLDADTTGILLFTTDGDLSQRMLHPGYHVSKHYIALVEGVPTEQELDHIRAGVVLGDGPCQGAACSILEPTRELLSLFVSSEPTCDEESPGARSIVEITLREGRKHQVKRMLSSIGHEVVALHRDRFGPITLCGVKPGRWRHLNESERSALLAPSLHAQPSLEQSSLVQTQLTKLPSTQTSVSQVSDRQGDTL